MMMKKQNDNSNQASNSNTNNKDDEEKSRKRITGSGQTNGTINSISSSSAICNSSSINASASSATNSKCSSTQISPGATSLNVSGSNNSKLSHLKIVNQATSAFLHNPNRITATTTIAPGGHVATDKQMLQLQCGQQTPNKQNIAPNIAPNNGGPVSSSFSCAEDQLYPRMQPSINEVNPNNRYYTTPTVGSNNNHHSQPQSSTQQQLQTQLNGCGTKTNRQTTVAPKKAATEPRIESNLDFNVTTGIESSQELLRLANKSPQNGQTTEYNTTLSSIGSTPQLSQTTSRPSDLSQSSPGRAMASSSLSSSPMSAVASWSKVNPGRIQVKSTTALDNESTSLSQTTESQSSSSDQSDQLSASGTSSSSSSGSGTGSETGEQPTRGGSTSLVSSNQSSDAGQTPKSEVVPSDIPQASVSLYTTECQREASCQIISGMADRYEPGALPTFPENDCVPHINTTIKVPMKYNPPPALIQAAAATVTAPPPARPQPPTPQPQPQPQPPPPVVVKAIDEDIVVNTTASALPKIAKRSKTKVIVPKTGSKAGIAGTRSYMRKMTGKANRNRRNNNAEYLKAGPGILKRAQAADMTLTGLPVLKGEVNRILTIKEQERTKANPATPNKIRMLLEEPFTEMSIITENLGLTGVGGLILERMKTFKLPVKCVVNVTYELPLFKVEGIETFRVPVADDLKEDISIYFDEVADKIEEIKNKNGVSIVHCMAGVSRSASIVMAYLIRYHKLTVKAAFKHAKAIRSIINPNLSFLEQLTEYEFKCHGQRFTKMVDHTINDVTKRLPDFIISDYLDEYLPVFEEFYN